MKSILTFLLIIVFATSLGYAGEGKSYGKKLSIGKKTPIADILKNPKKYSGKRVLIEGTITGVCQNMGCWMTVAADSASEAIRIKVEDGVIVFPKDGKGKTALAQGVVSAKTMSAEEQIEQGKHQASEGGGTFDSTSVKGAKVVVQIQGEGAVIR